MNLNMHIILDELMDLQPVSAIDDSIELQLKQIRIIQKLPAELSEEYLYLTDAGTYCSHSALFTKQNVVCIGGREMDRQECSCNVIFLDQALDLSEVYNRIQSIFEKYQAWDQQMRDVMINNRSLQELLDIGAGVLRNPIAALDSSLGFIMKAGKFTENYKGTIWDDVINFGYTRIENLSSQEQKDMFDVLYKKYEPFFYLGAEFKDKRAIIANLFINHKRIGSLGTVEIDQPFTLGQLSLIYHLKMVMETAIVNNKELNETLEYFYFIDRLIKGFSVEEKIVEFHLKKMQWLMKDEYVILNFTSPVIDFHDENHVKSYTLRISKLLGKSMIITYENAIVGIVRTKEYPPDDPEFLGNLDDLLDKLNCKCGMSMRFNHFMDLKYYYIQSKDAIVEGEKKNSTVRRYPYQEYYIGHLISTLGDSTSLKSLCHPEILKLRDFDRQHHADYVRCLYYYLLNGRNVVFAAKSLFLHRNTLTYRLSRINEMIQLDYDNEKELFQAMFSCLIVERL